MSQVYKALTGPNDVCKTYPTSFQDVLGELISAVTAKPIAPSQLAHALYDLVGFGLFLAFGEVPVADVASFLQQLQAFLANLTVGLPSWAGPIINLAIELFTAFVNKTPAINPPVG